MLPNGLWTKIKYNIRYRTQPYGLVSVRYLGGNLTFAQKKHRELLCHGLPQLPRTVFFVLNILLTARWYFYESWRSCYRTVRRFGSQVKLDSGVGYTKQLCETLALALLHTIPPIAYYQFKLYKPQSRATKWNFVYDHEIAAFHQSRNGTATQETKYQKELLADKFLWAKCMKKNGIVVADDRLVPIASSYTEFLNIASEFPLNDSKGNKVFCKPRSSARAIGAFSFYLNANNVPEIQTLRGHTLSGTEAIDTISLNLNKFEYLVQPYYNNHTDLRALKSPGNEAITVRVITEQSNGFFKPYCAYLELPVVLDSVKFYYTVQVEFVSGHLLDKSLNELLYANNREIDRISQAVVGITVPDWHEAINTVQRAHGHFKNIHAIAWDLIMTNDGPVLLEGNTNWNIALPQQLLGGLIICRSSDLSDT